MDYLIPQYVLCNELWEQARENVFDLITDSPPWLCVGWDDSLYVAVLHQNM